jgi:hypothetical protein
MSSLVCRRVRLILVEVARWRILYDRSLGGGILDSLLGLWIPYCIEHDFKMMWFNHDAARSQFAH